VHFKSKVDTWLLTTLLAGATVMVATVVGLTLFGGAPPLLLLLLAAPALIVWTLTSTSYDVTDTTLWVRSAFVRLSIPLSTIRTVRTTRSVLSAPALSLDRLEVQHTSGRVVVSPRDQAGFVKAIRDRVPGVAVEGFGPDGARLDRPVNLWWVTLIPVCVLAIVGFILLTPRAPLDVTLTPSVLRVDDLSVPFDRISAVSLEESLPAVRKSRGFNSPTTLRGRFTHAQLGTGEVFVRLKSPPYILARTTDGFLLFNMDDPERTRAVYEQLRARLSSRSEGLRVGGSEGLRV
jgi:hypothetical protein